MNSAVKTKKKRKDLHPTIYAYFHGIWGEVIKTNDLYCKIYQKTVLLTNSGVITSILGSQASNSTAVAPSLLISSGHNPRLGAQFSLGGAQPQNAPPPRNTGPVSVVYLPK